MDTGKLSASNLAQPFKPLAEEREADLGFARALQPYHILCRPRLNAERGKVRLSMKVVDQTTGKEVVRDKKKEEAEDAA